MLVLRRYGTFQGHMTDMTKGSPHTLIIRFGLPLIFANTLQQLYSMVDAMVLGNFTGTIGLAVLGACMWPIYLSVSLITNFSQAGCLVLSKRVGAGNNEALKSALGSIYALASLLCIVMMICMQLITEPLLKLLNTPTEILGYAFLYQRIIYAGIIPLFAYNIFSAFLRAIGDSHTPFYAILSATVVNIVLDILFVVKLQYGVVGAAIATILAQTVSAVVCLIRVFQYRQFKLTISYFRPQMDVLKEFFTLSLPMLLQSLVIAFGGFFVQTNVNAYGAAFTAGMSATDKVFGLLETSAVALAQSSVTFVGQNFGAKHVDRIRSGVRISIRISLAMAAFFMISMLCFGKGILSLFVAPEAIEAAWGKLIVTSVGLLVMYPMYVLRQSIQALGNAIIPLVAGIIQLIARILVSSYLPLLLGRAGLYFPTVIAWITSLILIGLIFPRQLRAVS